ncbi:MAG: DNA translocase FtsK, partial [Saprospiraceae bacterium]|nr:DNA translocase FtsK [Saprospiraceae bacterium]
MAKSKRGQGSLNFDNERLSKLLGMFLLFLSFYFLIAFTSYFFTWQNDHDIVFRFSWEMFLGDVEVDNWLGRLGAYLADSIIYWGFGVASFGFVYLLYQYGLGLIRRAPMSHLTATLRRTAIWMVIVSVVASFFFQLMEFPVGGVFGQAVSEWVQKFLGIPGTLALLVFALVAVFVWNNNPDLSDFTWRKFIYETKRAWRDLLSGEYGKRIRIPKPGISTGQTVETVLSADDQEIQIARPVEAEKASVPAGGQMAFDLSKKSALFDDDAPAKKDSPADNTELEINLPPAPTPVLPDEADAYKPPVEIIQEDNPNLSEPYDPTLELSHYEYPHLQLLHEYDNTHLEIDRDELEHNKNQILATLMNFKIDIEKIKATIGPTVTLYEIVPARGIRISKIKNLEDDIALNLSALGIRIIAPIPGKGTIGIEVPNKKRQTVGMREVLMDERFKRAKMELPIALGKNIQNEVFVADLTKMPHLLIAGATGQGKSVGINVILNSLLYKKHP